MTRVVHKPYLLSDNGSSYLFDDLAEWLANCGMGHVRGAPHHPKIRGKIERWHQTFKNRILLKDYYPPADLEAHITRVVDCHGRRRCGEECALQVDHLRLGNSHVPWLSELVELDLEGFKLTPSGGWVENRIT